MAETSFDARERDLADDAAAGLEMIRSEESLSVGTQLRTRGRVRVSKRLVTEEKTFTVTLRREELVVEELGDDAAPDPATSLDVRDPTELDGRELEFVLHEERVTTTTSVVPVERVRISVERVAGTTQVTDDVGREVVVAESTTPPTERVRS